MGPGVGSVDSAESAQAALAPYVPGLVVDWLEHHPDQRYRQITGTCVFADISGFTKLTERLAKRGKAGAEEMGDLLNATFDSLLSAAYDYGANLVKWGGDAVLLLFDGQRHAERAVRASWAMQEVIRQIGRLETSCGVVRLGMSIGAHTGEFDFMLVGSRYRELIVTGPAATMTAHMEKIAERGQIVVSTATKNQLAVGCVGAAVETGWRVVRSPEIAQAPNRSRKAIEVDLGQAFCEPLREHLTSGVVDHEHRAITVGFIEFSGTDELLATEGAQALAAAVEYVVDAAQEAAADNEVTVLSTDLCEDGGKIILISGAPRALGHDEARVLSAVRRVVHPGGRLALRAGVNAGAVFAGDYGPFYRRVYSVTGDCVNLAARLMAKAEAGQVIAMPEVLERSKTVFETTELEPFTVKGKSAPIHAMLVGDLRRVAAPRRGDQLPLIGRQEELSRILAVATAAGSGRGGVVEVVGGPGIGKSRLIEEVVDRSAARPMWAEGEIYGSTMPYRPMQRLFRHTIGLPDDVEDETLAAVITELTAGTAPDLMPWLPLIGVVAGVDLPSTPEIEALDPKIRKARLEAVVSDLLGRLLTTPIVMVFNDLYLMDDATIDLLKRLAADVRERPWLIVATRRPGTPSPFGKEHRATKIDLQPLPIDVATEFLVNANSDLPLPPHQIRRLAERAGGNPLFLRELIAGARAGSIEALPDSVEGVIAMRIDQLPPNQRRWLRSASVLGMTVDTELLAEVLDDPTAADSNFVSGLDEFVVEGTDGKLRFTHHLTRATAYEGLPYRRRTSLHATTAELIERRAAGREEQVAELLSVHCFYGELYERAWRFSRIAGLRARLHFALPEAAECLTRAVAAAEKLEPCPVLEVAAIDEELSSVYVDLGDFAAAERALAHGRRSAANDLLLTARLRWRTASARDQAARYADALRWVSRGRAPLLGRDDPESLTLLGKMAEVAASARYRQGKFSSSLRWARRAAEEGRRANHPRTHARGLEWSAMAAAGAGLAWDDESFDVAVGIYDELGDLVAKAAALNRHGACAYYAGRWDDAVRLYVESETAYWRCGREHDAVSNAANRAEVLIQQGRLDDVDEIINAAANVWLATNNMSAMAFGITLLGQAELARNEFPEALGHLAEARMLCVGLGETDEVSTIDALIALTHLKRGDFTTALEIAVGVLESSAHTGGPATPMLLRVRGEALIGLGKPTKGGAVLRASLDEARRRDARHEVAATIDSLLRAGAWTNAAERAAWSYERAAIGKSLGLVETDADLASVS